MRFGWKMLFLFFNGAKGIKRKNKTLSIRKQKQMPLHIQERLADFQTNPSLYKAMHSEIGNWKKDTDIIKGLGKFPDIPLIVIGRDKEYNIELGTMDGLPEKLSETSLCTRGESTCAE